MISKDNLLALYSRLYESYGPQQWWPAESRFEVMVGAVLTQNTSWKNVEKAIQNLQNANSLNLSTFHQLDVNELAILIRPSGYFNVKARRLKNLCAWLQEKGGVNAISNWETDELRNALLGVNGIGPETADDILLYAFDRPIFVIDTYTRRLLKSLNLIEGKESYESLRANFETALMDDTNLFNEYHALIVRHAKQKCIGAETSIDDDCIHCYVEKRL